MFLGLGLGISPRGGGGVSQPKLDLNFATGSYGVNGVYSSSLPAAWSYTRSLAAYGQTLTGTLTSFAVDTPRIISGRGLLLEPSRQNLAIYSQQFDSGSGWTAVNSAVTANARTAPDGTSTMDAVADSNTNNAVHRLQSAFVVSVTSGQDYSLSVVMDRGACDYLHMNLGAAAFGPPNAAVYNLNTGVVVSNTLLTASIVALANGQFRCVARCPAVATTTAQIFINPSTSPTSSSYVGVPSRVGAYAWGVQLELGSEASSYIPTVATAQTRGEDEPRLTIPVGASRYIIDLEGGTQLTGSVAPGDTFDFSPSAISGVSLKYVSRVRII